MYTHLYIFNPVNLEYSVYSVSPLRHSSRSTTRRHAGSVSLYHLSRLRT